MEQEQTVYCLQRRDVFAVMPTGIAFREVLE
jgi:superfamily II DNA helicase RecQ